ncbi:uncharacterized protein [Rutidosis leptorrhynchoides]|uniref:uncharacterized protein n=1 Tax=Rutidosis leptorrhynchoides TaxID=125765 RepID=UPI003A9A5D39
MQPQLFERIISGIRDCTINPLPAHFAYFRHSYDAIGRQSFNIYQKCTSALRQLAYGTAGDMWDQYLHMSEQTSLNCLDNFCLCVTDLYQDEYLRKPTARDIQRIYETHETRHGFRGMLGSIDCMHWEWKNCPVAWQGSNNDINVLNRSPLFDSIKNGSAPPSPFTVNGHDYIHGYYLADGIYPDWATLIKAYLSLTDEPSARFTRYQETARKDVERTFGVLQEDNGFAITSLDEEYLRAPDNRPIFVRNRNTTRAAREKEIHDKDMHNSLLADLTEHIWNLPPNYRRTI